MKKKEKIIILTIIIVLVILISIILIHNHSNNLAGTIKDGKVIYSDKIVNTTNYKTKQVIEIKSVNKLIDSLIITSEDYDKMKHNDSKYDRTLNEVLDDKNISNKDIYNIKKAIELNIVKDSDDVITYYAKITGLNTKKKFIKFCKSALELVKKDKNVYEK